MITDHIFALPTQDSSIVLDLTNLNAIILMKLDDDDTNQENSNPEI